MRDIVGVPTYHRPEFLYLTLEHLYDADTNCNHDVWVCHDRKFDDDKRFAQEWQETESVIAYWKRAYGTRLRAILRPENGYYGNSYNVLSFYAKAYMTEARYVYLVEDDVFITKDFFKWHEAVQNSEAPFCTIACQCDRNVSPALSDPNSFFESSEFASLGVCWRRENLSWVLEHAVPEYYHNSTPYILQKFPNSKLGLKMMEQDGLIQRIAETTHQKFVWASVPKAFHVGVYGYHRSIGKEMFDGTLPERIDKYRAAVSDPEWLLRVAGFQTDLQAFPCPPVGHVCNTNE